MYTGIYVVIVYTVLFFRDCETDQQVIWTAI